MLGDSDLFDAIMDISVTAARDAAPSLGISSAQADELGKKIGLSRFLSSICRCSGLYLREIAVPQQAAHGGFYRTQP